MIPYIFVPLGNGQVAIIDADMADVVLPHRWSVINGYAKRFPKKGEAEWKGHSGGRGNISIHKLVAQCEEGKTTDHINRNRLDNRRVNLRCATQSENCANSTWPHPTKSGYRGVKRRGRVRADGTERVIWEASVRKSGVRHHCGTYPTPEEAAAAYDRTALELFGQFAALNFPDGH